jgi:hypothetical protein
MNNNKYTGNKTICKIKFNGKIEAPRGTLPFSMPVKIKYQSVHGVTINIIKPICKSICPARNIFDKIIVNKGVKIKLMINEEIEKRKSENDFEISFISTFRKRTKSISIRKRKISIKFPAYFSRTGIVFPRNIPIKAAKTIDLFNNGNNDITMAWEMKKKR